MVHCPACSRPNRPAAQFCVGCGTRLDRSASGGAPSRSSGGEAPVFEARQTNILRLPTETPRTPPPQAPDAPRSTSPLRLPDEPRRSSTGLSGTDSGRLRSGRAEERRNASESDGIFVDRRREGSTPYTGVERRGPGDRRRSGGTFEGGGRGSRDTQDPDDPARARRSSDEAAEDALVLKPGVPARPICIVCSNCDRVTRKKTPYCEHCGRPLANVDGTVFLSYRWSGGRTPSGDRAIYALVTVRPAVRFLSSPPARNLGMLIDMSTSDGKGDPRQRMQAFQEILEHAIDELGPQDTLSVCFFGRRPYLFLTAERVEDKKATRRLLQKKMESLDLGDGRYLAEAMEQVCREVRRNLSPDRVNRVIVITDGAISDREATLQTCELEADVGISFSAMTLGSGSYVDFLAQLSATGHGKCYPDVDTRHVPEILSQELMTVRATFTTQVEMFVHVAPDWMVSRAFKISPVIIDLGRKFVDERTFSIKMIDLQLYEDQTILLELKPLGNGTGRSTLALCELVCDFPRDDVINMSFLLPVQVPDPQLGLTQESDEVLPTVRMIMDVFGQNGLGS